MPRSLLPSYLSASELRAHFVAVLSQLETTKGTVIICRWNKPSVILRGGTNSSGEPVIQMIRVQSRTGHEILSAARQST